MIAGIERTPPFVTVAAESTVRLSRRQGTDRSTARRTLWSMAPPDLERLHAVPPGEFTATRNRIAAELRKAGRPAEAQAVARLRRPSPALWAVNQLARGGRQDLAAFVEAVDRLRRVQLRDPRAAADALRAQRAALEALVARAGDLLRGADLAASPAILRRVSDTLMGAAADRDHARLLRRGALTEELAAPGFEAFSGARISTAPLRLVTRPETARAPAERDDAARRAEAVAAAERLERQALEHQEAVARLEAERAAAQARVAELGKELGAARGRARQATAAARRARRTATR